MSFLECYVNILSDIKGQFFMCCMYASKITLVCVNNRVCILPGLNGVLQCKFDLANVEPAVPPQHLQ
jgi:hypothetical protein